MIENDDISKLVKSDVFTPDNIVSIMDSKLKKSGNLLEPSVGKGNLLKYLDIEKLEKVDVYELKKEYIDSITNENINKYNKDFLKTEISQTYDNIIMNPPYIKAQDLSKEYRTYIKENYKELNKGIVDIYYAFILKCIRLLKEDGIMVSITPNSYLYNKSSNELRKYLFENRLIEEIIDYKDEKIFPGISVYCCITIFTKKEKEYLLYNSKKIYYSDINVNNCLFNLSKNDMNETLKGMCKISNGIATLKDKVYVHKEKLYDEPCWEEIMTSGKKEYVIYPYKNGNLIEENILKKENPNTYEYLLKNKDELSKRDKGNKKYKRWYAYGRSQSLIKPKNDSIYIPCFLNPDDIEKYIKIDKGMLFKGCLCVEPKDVLDIDKIRGLIISNKEYIKSLSIKRSNGWISVSSRVLYNIHSA